MTPRPKSFLERASEDKQPEVQEHFRTTWEEKLELHTHILKRRRSVSDWLREAAREKMARELEEDMRKAAEPDVSADIAGLLLRRT
jgi:rubrerythrin